jgi:hypothetical protein
MKRGRPPLDPADRSVSVSSKIPGRQFDQLCVVAKRAALSVPALIRREIKELQNIQAK